MLKAIVSPLFRLFMAVTRLVMPALKSLLLVVLTTMVAARPREHITMQVVRRRNSFFIGGGMMVCFSVDSIIFYQSWCDQGKLFTLQREQNRRDMPPSNRFATFAG